MRRPFHPFVYTLLYLPFGTASGFATVALAYRGTRAGMTANEGAQIVAVFLTVAVFKFFAAPIADLTLSRKRWYLISAVATAVTFGALCIVPMNRANLRLIELLVLVSSAGASFLGFAVEGLAAYLTDPKDHGRMSGWLQAGNLGGQGLGGGLVLWLLEHTSSVIAGTVMVASVAVSALLLPLLSDVPSESSGQTVAGAIKHLGVDLWQVVRSRLGFLSAVMCFMPVGTGAAQNIFAQSELAGHWHATADQVALTQGALAGLIAMAGCLVGGYICNHLRPLMAYLIFGAVMAGVAATMVFLPTTPAGYITGTMAYNFATGLTYSAFSAFVFHAIGHGNAATKYNGFASLSNIPIDYMTVVLGASLTRFGPNGLLWTECLAGAAGIVLFIAIERLLPRRELLIR